MLEQIWLIPLGFAAGLIGSIIGLGGGLIVVPILTLLGVPPTLAASNGLFTSVSTSISSTISYSRQKRIEYSLGLKLVLLYVPGNILGAFVSAQATPEIFKILFAFVLISASIYIFIRRKLESKERTITKQIMIFAIGASFFAGTISSFFGIGGGVVFVPLMVVIMGLSMKRAAPTSQFILMFGTTAGLITHTLLGHTDFVHGLWLVIGAFIGGLTGARLSREIQDKRLKIIVSTVLFIAAIKLIIDAVFGFNYEGVLF